MASFGRLLPMNDKPNAKGALLDAARICLQQHGYAGLSTRRVADQAGAKLSQIHYYFGSKTQLVLSLLERENERLLDRQSSMFSSELSLADRWRQACDFLEEDLASGYVRILQEMMAAGWTDPEIAQAVRALLRGWYELLERVATEAAERLGGLGPLRPVDVAGLVGHAFLGAETMLLLGFEEREISIREALRRFGDVISELEDAQAKR